MIDKPVTRDGEEWPEAVSNTIRDTLGQVSFGSHVRVIKCCVSGPNAYVVYLKDDEPVLYGLCVNTYEDPTGSNWNDHNQVGRNFALLDIHEPHVQAPEEYWMDPQRCGSDLRLSSADLEKELEDVPIYWRNQDCTELPPTLKEIEKKINDMNETERWRRG